MGWGKKMTEKTLLAELNEAVLRGTPESRLRALWHTTDLLITGRYSDGDIWTFGEVIGRLADEIETAARAQLSEKLARFDQAPANIVRKLAFDHAIEVARPVLEESKQLDTDTLVAAARSTSQAHMLAISRRRCIDERVTDELVTRGNQEVVQSLARNSGARLSDFGFLHLIKRSDGDNILAEQLGVRTDISRHLFQQLVAKASDEVKKRLARANPAMFDQIQSSVAEVAGALHAKLGPVSRTYFVAKRLVTAQHQNGNLNESSISGYARSHKFDEVTIGMSLLCGMPPDVIERALMDSNGEMVLVLAKALDFSWDTTMSLLFLGAKDHRISARDLKVREEEYARLAVDASRSVLELYQTRKSGDVAVEPPRLRAAMH